MRLLTKVTAILAAGLLPLSAHAENADAPAQPSAAVPAADAASATAPATSEPPAAAAASPAPAAAAAPSAPAAPEPMAADLADMASILSADIDVGLKRLMELESQLNRSVESASRKSEQVFDSPLSATVLTREEILRSGVRTIPEALRLVPGLIVREQTTGNYDIHIRGFDNIPPQASLKDSSNTTTLVMIDYRVVYSYFQGGTFWETLPIDLQDVERIEIVRGPTAAIHGPNAVTGAINIITRRPKESGFTGSANVQGGNTFKSGMDLPGQRLANGFVGYKQGAWSGTFSTNYQRFDRIGSGYWSFAQGGYIEDPAEICLSGSCESRLDNTGLRFPEQGLALERLGANARITYQAEDQLETSVQAGFQKSRAQKIFFDQRRTPLSTNDSTSGYTALHSRFQDASARVAFTFGEQATPLLPANPKRPDITNPNGYTFNVLDVQADYRLRLFAEPAGAAGPAPVWSGLELQPALNYRRALASGPLIGVVDSAGLVLDPDRTLQSMAASLYAETGFFGRLKLVGAFRLEHYFDRTEPDYYARELNGKTQAKEGQADYPAWELAATFKAADDQLLRAVYSRAHRSPFFYDSFAFDEPVTFIYLHGNRALDLLTSDMGELGYRARLTKNLQADLEFFGAYTRNYYLPYLHFADPGRGKIVYQYDNIDLKALQYGATASLGFQMKRLNANLFVTAQKTRYWDYVPELTHFIELNFDPVADENKVSASHKGTPAVFGGGTFNLQPINRLEVNASVYTYSSHTLQRNDVSQGLINPTYTEAKYDVKSKVIVNALVAYRVIDQVSLYVNARNLLNMKQQEYAWSDEIPAVFMAGLSAEY